jgi:lipopolysaccharide export system protein LptA
MSRASAQAEPVPGDSLPVQIQSDSGIEWQQEQHLYIARGNAIATRGPSEVHADTLIAHYREAKGGNAGGNTEIYRVEAEGHVTLSRGTQTVVGDRAVDDIDQATTVITGKGLKMTTPTDVVTARDSLEWYDQKQVAVARGHAVAIRNGRTIKGDVLTAYMVKSAPVQAKAGAQDGRPAAVPGKPPVTAAAAPGGTTGGAAEADSKISRVDAQGHVVVSNALDTGRGDFGVYNADTGIATLIGHVVIERGKDVIRGQRGVMDLNNNVSRVMPGDAPDVPHQRVQGLFVRQEQSGSAAASGAAPSRGPAAADDKKP